MAAGGELANRVRTDITGPAGDKYIHKIFLSYSESR
jgi:hypothetical protein